MADELEYQKQQRLRELMRDLENCVVNGRAPAATAEGPPDGPLAAPALRQPGAWAFLFPRKRVKEKPHVRPDQAPDPGALTLPMVEVPCERCWSFPRFPIPTGAAGSRSASRGAAAFCRQLSTSKS